MAEVVPFLTDSRDFQERIVVSPSGREAIVAKLTRLACVTLAGLAVLFMAAVNGRLSKLAVVLVSLYAVRRSGVIRGRTATRHHFSLVNVGEVAVPVRDHRRAAWTGDAWNADVRAGVRWTRTSGVVWRVADSTGFVALSEESSTMELSVEILRQAFLPSTRLTSADVNRMGDEARRVSVVNGARVLFDDPAKQSAVISWALLCSDAQRAGAGASHFAVADPNASSF